MANGYIEEEEDGGEGGGTTTREGLVRSGNQWVRPPGGNGGAGPAGAGGPPPQGFTAPDFSRREEFEHMVFQRIGGNPFDIDPMEAVTAANKALPQLFRHVFQGKVLWQDRGKLSSRQQKLWQEVSNQFRADEYEKASRGKKVAVDKYNWLMTKFDNYKKEYEAAEKRQTTAAERARKPPEMKEMEGVWHQWDPDKGKWTSTGVPKAAKKEPEAGKVPEAVSKAQALVLGLVKRIDPGMAANITANPKLAANPAIRAMLEGEKLPDPVMQAYEDAQIIIRDFYAGQMTPEPEEKTAKSDTTVDMEYVPGEGLKSIARGKIIKMPGGGR